MSTTFETVQELLTKQIARIEQQDLVARIEELLVPIRLELAGWDYGEKDQAFPCWIVAYDPDANIVFAYSEHGFGPSYPWGMFRPGSKQSMGMDNCWYLTLEDVIRESIAWHGENPHNWQVA